MMDARDCCS